MSVDVAQSVRDTLLAALQPLVAGTRRIALLDFPAHGNVGDSAIWLGALAALRAVGAPSPSYTCDVTTYDRAALKRKIGAGTILFTGGGSFGDLWERHLLFRERVIADFPNNRIIQLPESVHFERPESLARSSAVFDAHPDITILVRDAASLAIVRREYHTPSHLVPDLAFGLGVLRRVGAPTRDILWLKRKDKEDRWPSAATSGRGEDVIDWLDEEKTPLIAWTDHQRWQVEQGARLGGLRRSVLALAQSRLARARMARGTALLSSARVVITDRLHGHIMALLLGIPHVVLDNSYGKVHRYVKEWTVGSPLVRLAASPDEALEHARSLAAAMHD
ncbi:polysaccharide pyruvyl transferase family protein [soil metagenome]